MKYDIKKSNNNGILESDGEEVLSESISSEEAKSNTRKKKITSLGGTAGTIFGGALGISGTMAGKKYNPEQ